MFDATQSNDTRTNAENLSLIDEVIRAVATGSVQQRLRILQRVTDLFVAGSHSYSSAQLALFDDLLRQLAVDIEVSARAKLAHRLVDIPGGSPKVIRMLAFDDEIEVAGPVLAKSPQLSDEDLVENATSKSQKHLLAIAQRLKLSEAVTDVLVERGDRRVVHKVASNKGARFSLAGYGKLTNRARHDRRLTLVLGQRSDIPRQYFIRLLATASASVRAKLEAANPQAAAAIRNTIDEVATAMQKEARVASHEYSAALRDANRRHNIDPVTETNVHATARAQEFERTVVALSKYGRFPVDLVERALLDEGADMILILAKAAGCSWLTAKELLAMYHAKRNLTPDDLTRAFERYKKLSQETAQSIIKFHGRRMKMKALETSAEKTPVSAKSAPPAARGLAEVSA
ncbi:MAG: DUF2336 domain-containing protein [Rhizobiales bacterium]|nr:DUF2336 domain-containing protein [Hyphomicrobiales bacterium]